MTDDHRDDRDDEAARGRLAGRVCVITGAASGIGAGTARTFVREGALVVVADLQDDAGRALVDELGDSARFAHCDVTVEDDVAAAVETAVSEFGSLDVMFNNAGIVGAVGSIAQMPTEAWDNTISILLRGVFLGVKHAARVMLEQGSGAIVNTSSTAGVMGGLGPHAYTAAKHGVIGLTKSTANELAPHGIRVNAISPGNTVTTMTASVMGDASDIDNAGTRIASTSPLGYAGFPEDIANAALYLASDESRYVTGHTLVVDAGQTSSGMVPNRFNSGSNRQIHEAGRTT
ncbi:glucose 1-dehydrogenase [Ilumatobacter sp.]|uniref:glucose 1-dehydrogenase n=1 Tax=Ilumatobacter sp. TaxID=1967498 RepID=UPI003B526446